ncbi:MAG: adenine deaminase [Omnitrophica WOR_2 bacterium]
MNPFDRRQLVAVARGDAQPDILIQNVTLYNVLTATIDAVDIGILGNRIAFVIPAGTSGGEAGRVIDGHDLYAVPGFVDGHVHNESSMVTPAQWARVLLRRGTTTVFTDPHEIGNVMGLPGIRYMQAASQGLPMRYYITAPSCVPAVPSLETAGATITHAEMRELLSWERVVAVAEAMDFPGLIYQGGNITPISQVAHELGKGIEGHAPGVVGRMLQAYLAAAGPSASDHESSLTNEMLEKVHSGMMVYAKSSTFVNDTTEIAAALKQVNDTRMFGLCTDDIMPHHLLEHGHMNYGIQQLIASGVPAMTAYQMATINVASHYRIPGLGGIAPGWLADIVLLRDIEQVQVEHVISDGRIVVNHGRLVVEIAEPVEPITENSVRIPSLSEQDFVFQPGGSGEMVFNGLNLASIFTMPATIKVTVQDGRVAFPLPEGVSLAAIVPRHNQGTRPSLALACGYALKEGAVASTVSHDSHNLAVIGRNPADMLAAAQELKRVGGGLTAVKNGAVLATLPLPVAGLMNPSPVEEVAAQLERYEACLPEIGLPKAFPSDLLALALPVVPMVRLTDRGLVDVATQKFIPQTAA